MSGRIALGLVRDLFFRSKIDAVAAAVGAEVLYASSLDAAADRCGEKTPQVVFADLSDATFPARETAAKIRGVAPGARLVGFASHIDLKPLKRRGMRASSSHCRAANLRRGWPSC